MFALFWPQMVFDTRATSISGCPIPDRLSRPSEKCQCRDCPKRLLFKNEKNEIYTDMYESNNGPKYKPIYMYIYIYRSCRHRQHTKHQHNGCHNIGEGQMSPDESSGLSALFLKADPLIDSSKTSGSGSGCNGAAGNQEIRESL